MDTPEVTGTTPNEAVAAPAPAVAEAVAEPTSIHDIGRSVLDGMEAEEDGGQAEAPAVEAEVTPAVEEGQEASEEETSEEQPDEILDSLANISRDDLPEAMRPLYDQLVESRKSMQADYTRKTQAIADERREKSALEQQVETMAAQLEALNAPKPDQTGPAPIDEVVYAGLGERLTIEKVMESNDPVQLERLIEQRATAISRKVVLEAMDTAIMPQLSHVVGGFEQQQVASAAAEIDRVAAAHPDLAPHMETVVRLVEAGFAPTLDEAVPQARALVLGQKREAEAFALGQAAAEARREKIDSNKEKFDVPSGATAPKGGPVVNAGMSFREIGRAALAANEQP